MKDKEADYQSLRDIILRSGARDIRLIVVEPQEEAGKQKQVVLELPEGDWVLSRYAPHTLH